MAEYIERGALLDQAVNGIVAAIDVLYAPAADVVPVVHGRWIAKTGRAMCSVCADECWADSVLEYNYCPNCGARMDGDTDV